MLLINTNKYYLPFNNAFIICTDTHKISRSLLLLLLLLSISSLPMLFPTNTTRTISSISSWYCYFLYTYNRTWDSPLSQRWALATSTSSIPWMEKRKRWKMLDQPSFLPIRGSYNCFWYRSRSCRVSWLVVMFVDSSRPYVSWLFFLDKS